MEREDRCVQLHRTKNEQTRALLPEQCVTCLLVLSSVKVSGPCRMRVAGGRFARGGYLCHISAVRVSA